MDVFSLLETHAHSAEHVENFIVSLAQILQIFAISQILLWQGRRKNISMRAVSAVRRAKHHCREYVCDEADYWHRCYHEMEAAYYAVKSALDAERQRCMPCVVLPSSPRLRSPRQEVSESREEIVRTVQDSHKQQVESYKVEVETTLKKLETALKTGRDFSIPSQ